MVKTFMKNPLVISAVQWTGNYDEIAEFIGYAPAIVPFINGTSPQELMIKTLEGDHIASMADWVIKGIKGEFYPCKPDVFSDSYTEVL